jgi:hypothetical protein
VGTHLRNLPQANKRHLADAKTSQSSAILPFLDFPGLQLPCAFSLLCLQLIPAGVLELAGLSFDEPFLRHLAY